MKKIICLLGTSTLCALTLMGCQTTTIEGEWTLEEIKVSGEILKGDDLLEYYGGEMHYTFHEDGTVEGLYNDNIVNGEWTQEDKTMTMTVAGVSTEFELSGNKLTRTDEYSTLTIVKQ